MAADDWLRDAARLDVMYPSTRDLLGTIKTELLKNVAPATEPGPARLAVDLITMLLTVLEARHSVSTTVDRDGLSKAVSLLAQAQQVIDSPMQASLTRRIGGLLLDLSERSSLQVPSRAIADVIESVLLVSADAWQQPGTEALVRRIIRVEADRCEAFVSALAAAEASVEQQLPQPPISADLFSRYLRGRYPEYPKISATSCEEVGGGFSKRTYRIRIHAGPADIGEVIVRQDMVGGTTRALVSDEVAVLAAARKAGIPVPQVYWADHGATFGAGFIVMEVRPGRCGIREWLPLPGADKPPAIMLLAQHLAQLHNLPLACVGVGETKQSIRDMIRQYIDIHEQRWREVRCAPEPLLIFAFEWLKRNIPDGVERMSIVHTDISERNILLEDGRISAVLDWELWHISDPNEDLAYARPFVEQVTEWPRFLKAYRDSGGPRYREENGRFWSVWAPVRILVYIATGIRSFQNGDNRTTKLITPLVNYYPRILLDLSRVLAAL